jgi:hypothetical protein
VPRESDLEIWVGIFVTLIILLAFLITKTLRYHDLNVLATENKVITRRITKFTTSQRTQFISFTQKTQLMLLNIYYVYYVNNTKHMNTLWTIHCEQYIVNKTQSLEILQNFECALTTGLIKRLVEDVGWENKVERLVIKKLTEAVLITEECELIMYLNRLFHLGMSRTVFVLICTVVVLNCF